MTTEKIEIKADSLDEARRKLKEQIPEGLYLRYETVLLDGSCKSAKITAFSREEMSSKVPINIPEDAVILERKVLAIPRTMTIMLQAADPASLQAMAQKKAKGIDANAEVMSLELKKSGRQGFLGLGKKLDQYQAVLFIPGLLEITYRNKAWIIAEIGEKRQEDWTLEDWVTALRNLPIVAHNDKSLYDEWYETNDLQKAAQKIGKRPYIVDDYITWCERESKTEWTYRLSRIGESTWGLSSIYEFLD